MQLNQQPALVPLAFAAGAPGGDITLPPLLSQIGVANGRASLTDGFPPLCFVPVTAGGVPPFGADFNGVLNLVTQHARMLSAGAGYVYNAAFAVSAQVGGYPKGAILTDAGGAYRWQNLVDGNMSDPAGAPVAASFSGSTAASVLTTTAVTGVIAAGQLLTGAGVSAGIYVTGQLTGTAGGAGTYSLSQSAGTIGAEAMTSGTSNWAILSPSSPYASFQVAGAFQAAVGAGGSLAVVADETNLGHYTFYQKQSGSLVPTAVLPLGFAFNSGQTDQQYLQGLINTAAPGDTIRLPSAKLRGFVAGTAGVGLVVVNKPLTLEGTFPAGRSFYSRLQSEPTIAAGGSGYKRGQVLQISGGTFNTTPVLVEVSSVDPVTGGVATVFVIDDGMYGTTPANPAATTVVGGGGGTGCTLTLTWQLQAPYGGTSISVPPSATGPVIQIAPAVNSPWQNAETKRLSGVRVRNITGDGGARQAFAYPFLQAGMVDNLRVENCLFHDIANTAVDLACSVRETVLRDIEARYCGDNLNIATLNATPAAAGSGYVVGETMRMLDGSIVRVLSISGGAVVTFALISPSRTSVVANPVGQSATTQAGTGFQMTVTGGSTGASFAPVYRVRETSVAGQPASPINPYGGAQDATNLITLDNARSVYGFGEDYSYENTSGNPLAVRNLWLRGGYSHGTVVGVNNNPYEIINAGATQCRKLLVRGNVADLAVQQHHLLIAGAGVATAHVELDATSSVLRFEGTFLGVHYDGATTYDTGVQADAAGGVVSFDAGCRLTSHFHPVWSSASNITWYAPDALMVDGNASGSKFDFLPVLTQCSYVLVNSTWDTQNYTWAGRPQANAQNVGRRILVTDLGPLGGTYFISDGSRWKPPGGVLVLAQSGAGVNVPADTTLDTLVTVSVPAGLMGADDGVSVDHAWTFTGSTNSKTMQVIFGTMTLMNNATAAAGNISGGFRSAFQNAHATNAQISYANTASLSGFATTALTTGTNDTAAGAVSVIFKGQKAVSGETLTLSAYKITMTFS